MAKLLFHLRGVPHDELEEINSLLISNSIDFYETTSGNWGLSVPALWVKTELEHRRARTLLNQYQIERSSRARQDFLDKNTITGSNSFIKNFKSAPFGALLVLLAIALVAALSVTIFPH
jgi:hypothetical protein